MQMIRLAWGRNQKSDQSQKQYREVHLTRLAVSLSCFKSCSYHDVIFILCQDYPSEPGFVSGSFSFRGFSEAKGLLFASKCDFPRTGRVWGIGEMEKWGDGKPNSPLLRRSVLYHSVSYFQWIRSSVPVLSLRQQRSEEHTSELQ